MSLEVAVPVLITIISAATPLLLAGIGELVVERSGVLNLGVEGMMLAGAVTAFAVAFATGSYTLGILGGRAGRHADGPDLRRAHADPGQQPGRHRPCAHPVRPGPQRAARRRLRRLADPAAAQARDPRPLDHPGARAGPVRPGRPGLPVRGADHRHRLVPQAHPRRHDPACLRRQRRLGPLDRLRRHQDPLHGRPVRRHCARAWAGRSCRSPTRRCGSRT